VSPLITPSEARAQAGLNNLHMVALAAADDG
jgi:hypothetical protein